MIVLREYDVAELVDQSANVHIYRGRRTADSAPLIFKVPRVDANDAPGTRSRILNEHSVLAGLNAQGVVRAAGLEVYQGLPVLVLEDSGLSSLRKILDGKPMPIDVFLDLALRLTEVVGRLHQEGIVHKDINPSNILWSADTKALELIDFGIATRGSQELESTNLLVGTLAYLSPEQTGRMNRSVDYRTDFYALGMTFYELVTGRTAFSATDTMELLHCHIAKTPASPSEIAPEVPAIVSDLILKLVAKMPEERYQSAHGLATDLRELQGQLSRGEPLGGFTLAARDVSQNFQLSQKLYGRDAETAKLLAAFENARAGKVEVVTVRGYAGIGKSRLVHDAHRPIVKLGGYFASGGSERAERDVPCGAVIRACKQLCRDLLLESPERLARWKTHLAEAAFADRRVLSSVLPEIDMLLGDEPPSVADARVSPATLTATLQRFLGVFGALERPVVLFLDDLERADAGTLALIESLTTSGAGSHVLLALAYRDNEVDASHPLSRVLERAAEKRAVRMTDIVVNPLAVSDVDALVAETLSRSEEDVLPLGAVLHDKSGGSPFFLGQLLGALHEERLLRFDHETGRWDWDLAGIESVEITDNVVELMVDRIRRMTKEGQRALKLAACVGKRFELGVIATIERRTSKEILAEIWEALQDGFIVPIDGPTTTIASGARAYWFQFHHERVRQAAYAMLSSEERAALRLNIGRILLRDDAATRNGASFDVLGHFMAAAELLDDPSERETVARIALAAGRRARTALEYEDAVHALAFGKRLLAESAWENTYSLAFELHLELARAEYSRANIDEAACLFATVIEHARTPTDKANAYRARIALAQTAGRFAEALELGRAAVGLFGISLPAAPTDGDVDALIDELASAMGDRSPADLIDLPPMTDPEQLSLSETLAEIVATSYFVSPNFHASVALRALIQAVRFGQSPSLVIAACGAAVAIMPRGHVDLGFELGKLGFELAEKLDIAPLQARAHFEFGDLIRHRKNHHVRSNQGFLEQAFLVFLEVGDVGGACHSLCHMVANDFALGRPLAEARADAARRLEHAAMANSMEVASAIRTIDRAFMALLGLTNDTMTYAGEGGFDDDAYDASLATDSSAFVQALHHHHHAFVQYVFGNFPAALATDAKTSDVIWALHGQLEVEEHLFYQALIHLGVWLDVPEAERGALLEKARENETKLRALAVSAPVNYEHKRLLVAAEIARVTGSTAEAADLYDQAIESALSDGWVHHAAIACERALRFHAAMGRTARARGYAIEAVTHYGVWGATAKVSQLAERYRALFPSARTATSAGGTIVRSTQTTAYALSSANGLDLSTVTKATQAISSEIHLDRLLQTLTRILIENAGAERGFIVLDRGGKLVIEASGGQSHDSVAVLQSTDLEKSSDLPVGIVSYVARTKQSVVLDNAAASGAFVADPYIAARGTKSLLCLPIMSQSRLVGVIYLENDLSIGCFDIDRLAAVRILLGQMAISIENAALYANLEEKVRERTHELHARERAMQLVLDSTGDGLLSVGLGGAIHQSPSRAAVEWFGSHRPGILLWDYVSSGNATFDCTLAFAFEQLVGDVLPFEVAADQMPRRLERGDRTLELEYRQVFEDGVFASVLVIVRDITLAVEAQRAETDALEKQNIIGHLLSDRDGVQRFLADTAQLLVQMRSTTDIVLAKRLLHTLKGNSATFGLTALAAHCHEIEGRLAESEEPVLAEKDVTALEQRFGARVDSIRDFLYARDANTVRVREDELTSAIEVAKTADRRVLLDILESWRWYPSADYLETLTEQTTRLAARLGKKVAIAAEDNGLRVEPGRLDPFLSSLIHVVRNAIDHGLEPEEERIAAGKRAVGTLRLVTRLTKEHLIFEIGDDGRGIDLDALAAAARNRGLVFRGPEDAVELLFADGVSTRDEVTDVSGRGVGLGAVRETCERLGGRVTMTWHRGRGTTFTFEFPAALARAPRPDERSSGLLPVAARLRDVS